MLIAIFSFFLGIFIFYSIHKIRTGGFEKLGMEILKEAEKKTAGQLASLELALQQKELDHKKNLEKLTEIQQQKNNREKERLEKREDLLDQRSLFIEKETLKIEEIKKDLAREKNLAHQKIQLLIEKERHLLSETEKASQMSMNQAKEFLLEKCQKEIQHDLTKLEEKLKKEKEESCSLVAKKMVLSSLQRLNLASLSETTQASVSLPNEEMKKRIIGREGRNIRALEYATGASFIVDDTPGAVVISSFDPIRKEIAKLALKELMKDGRIHPLRIEEVVQETTAQLDKSIEEMGRNSAAKAGVHSLNIELSRLLGKLHFCQASGQNVLEHSLEVSFIMGLLAAELQLDVKLAKRIGLLHDIGKAASHEWEGSHAAIGSVLALKYGENESVANGIGCHHEEIPPETMESALCPIANKLSSIRPGARIEALDQYVARVRKLEALSSQIEGLERVYALQTGKEIRIIVEPDKFDDQTAAILAKKIAKKIEKELSYPGKIKVTVIREKKVVEYAC